MLHDLNHIKNFPFFVAVRHHYHVTVPCMISMAQVLQMRKPQGPQLQCRSLGSTNMVQISHSSGPRDSRIEPRDVDRGKNQWFNGDFTSKNGDFTSKNRGLM
jgi:hypothetical protein